MSQPRFFMSSASSLCAVIWRGDHPTRARARMQNMHAELGRPSRISSSTWIWKA